METKTTLKKVTQYDIANARDSRLVEAKTNDWLRRVFLSAIANVCDLVVVQTNFRTYQEMASVDKIKRVEALLQAAQTFEWMMLMEFERIAEKGMAGDYGTFFDITPHDFRQWARIYHNAHHIEIEKRMRRELGIMDISESEKINLEMQLRKRVFQQIEDIRKRDGKLTWKALAVYGEGIPFDPGGWFMNDLLNAGLIRKPKSDDDIYVYLDYAQYFGRSRTGEKIRQGEYRTYAVKYYMLNEIAEMINAVGDYMEILKINGFENGILKQN
jgi:hypothetical protein